jgi:secretion/DNA translocation related TadE-like protein
MRGFRAAHRDRGAGSVLMLCAGAVVLTVALAVLTLATAAAARHRAATAADLAALAGAGQARLGAVHACAMAAAVAEENGGVLTSCELTGQDVVVTVAAAIAGPAGWLPDPVRRARAGPSNAGLATVRGPGAEIGLAIPISGNYRITARFGDAGSHWATGRHSGLDFAAVVGTPVLAAAPGRVVAAGPAGRYGNLVIIDHGGVVTYYAHLSTVTVAVGDVLAAGQHVGAVGSSGNTTGPHLHFEVRVGGVSRDPAAYLP